MRMTELPKYVTQKIMKRLGSLIDKETKDQGSYLLVLELKRSRNIQVGKLGRISFRRGFYIYVGSAMAHLSKRIERHRHLAGTCPGRPALQGGIKGHNIKEIPNREAPPFRAGSFTKRHHWHIDELRAVADFHSALAVRSSTRLECEIARALSKIAERAIPGFGCTDCSCDTHLFAFERDPFHLEKFHQLLRYFRMDRYTKERSSDVVHALRC
jgi:sugar fermentation stimulation protein A